MFTNLRALGRRLWTEQDGFVVSSEVVLTGSLLLGGAVAGLTQIRESLTQELGDFSQAIGNLDQSYSVSGIRGHSAWTAGSAFYDRADVGDGVVAQGQQVFAPGNRFADPNVRPTVCADIFPTAPRAFVPPHPPIHPPHIAPPPVKPQPPQVKKPVAPPKKVEKKPSPKDGAAVVKPVAPQPVAKPVAACGHHQATAGCQVCVPTANLYAGCTPQAVGCFPPNTNYSFTSLGLHGFGPYGYGYGGGFGQGYNVNPYGYRQWGNNPGAVSTVIDFQPAGVPAMGAMHAPGGFTGGVMMSGQAVGVPGQVACPHPVAPTAPCVAAPCVTAPKAPCMTAPACVATSTCGTIPVWGPREGSLPQQRIVFTGAPQPGDVHPPKHGHEGIELRFSEVGDDDLKPLKGFADVKVLHIHGSRVTDEGISNLKGLKKLEVLHLVGTQITNEGLEQLAALSNLRVLHIHGGKLTVAGLKVLRKLDHLQVLEIYEAGVPREAVERFFDEQPKPSKKD